MTRFFAWSSTHEHCRRPRVYGTRKAVPPLAQTRDKHGPLGLGGRRADKPHSNARKHTRRHGRRAQSHPHCGHGGSWAVQVVLAGRYPSTSVRRSSSRSRLQLLVEGVGEMRCDLSSVQQHVRVDQFMSMSISAARNTNSCPAARAETQRSRHKPFCSNGSLHY